MSGVSSDWERPIKSLARAQSHNQKKSNGKPKFPTSYKKRDMWHDLQEIINYISHLEDKIDFLTKRIEKLDENLKRFAPGDPVVGDFSQ